MPFLEINNIGMGGLNRLGINWPISLTAKPVICRLKRSLNDLPSVPPVVHDRARMEETLPREAALVLCLHLA